MPSETIRQLLLLEMVDCEIELRAYIDVEAPSALSSQKLLFLSGSSPEGVRVLQEKSASYECFHAHNDIVTVALFAPKTARRVSRIPSRGNNAPAKVRMSVWCSLIQSVNRSTPRLRADQMSESDRQSLHPGSQSNTYIAVLRLP